MVSIDPFRLLIRFQALAQAYHIIEVVSDFPVKRHDLGIGAAHLQLDFGTTRRPQACLGGCHHAPADAGAPVMGMDGEIVDPPPVAVVSGHNGGDYPCAQAADEEHLRLHAEFAADVPARIVPGHDQAAIRPQLNDLGLITGRIGSDSHFLFTAVVQRHSGGVIVQWVFFKRSVYLAQIPFFVFASAVSNR